MGWTKWAKSMDEHVIPQKEDSVGRIIEKAVFSPLVAPLTVLDLLADEPRSDRGGSSPHGGQGSGGHGGGGCTCTCTCTCR